MEGKGRRNSLLYILISVVFFLEQFCTMSESAQAPAMFIFGDSLVDNGNNNYLPTFARANYPPFGIDSGGPTGRFCNGLSTTDFAARYIGLKSPPPYLSLSSKTKLILRGVNYASAAAGILDETGMNLGVRIPLNQQIAQFKHTVRIHLPLLIQNQAALSKFIADSIFSITIGSNDYLNNYLMPLIYSSSRLNSSESFAKLLVHTLSQQLETLYQLGARKFVVAGVGPLGCTPFLVALNKTGNGQCIDSSNDLALTYNKYLLQLVNQLNSSLCGSFLVYKDIYTSVIDMISNPSKYGFTVVNKACCVNKWYGGEFTCLPLEIPCTDRDKYVFWDSLHPTQAVNAIVAARCYGENATDCYPISGSMLAKL